MTVDSTMFIFFHIICSVSINPSDLISSPTYQLHKHDVNTSSSEPSKGDRDILGLGIQ